jgi:WD40 repeat protein
MRQTGELKRTLSRFGEPVSSCVWAPDGQSFITGCLDKERNLCQWNLNGDLIYDWGQNHRIQDLAISPDSNRLIAMEHESHVYIYNLVTRELEYEVDLKARLYSVAVSQNSQHLLINKSDGEAQMFDLDNRETVRVFNSGDRQGQFIIRATFGGADEAFVVTGSEGMPKKLGNDT